VLGSLACCELKNASGIPASAPKAVASVPKGVSPIRYGVGKLDRQRKQASGPQVDILFGGVTADTAQEDSSRHAELRVLAKFFPRMCSGAASKKCEGPLAKLSDRPSAHDQPQ